MSYLFSLLIMIGFIFVASYSANTNDYTSLVYFLFIMLIIGFLLIFAYVISKIKKGKHKNIKE